MGNRAVITFDKNPTPQSLGIYLHWNGGEESVLAFVEAANHFKVRGGDDDTYQLARITQIIANFFGGTTSIGVGKLENLDCENYDNGVFAVSRNNGTTIIEQDHSGKLDKFTPLDLAKIKSGSGYWKPDDNGKTILDHVIDKNAALFTTGG